MSARNSLTVTILAQGNSNDRIETPFVSGPTKDLAGGTLFLVGIVLILAAIFANVGTWINLQPGQRKAAGSVGFLMLLSGLAIVFIPEKRSFADPQPSPENPALVSCQYEIDSVETAKIVESECQKLLGNDSGNYEISRNLGRAQLLLWDSQDSGANEEDLNEAIGNFETAVQLSDFKDANSLFHHALALSIRHFENYDNRYEVGPAREAYERAFGLFIDPAMQVQEIDFIPMVETGHYLAKSCRYDEANQIYERVLEKDSDEYSALVSHLIALAAKAKQEKSSGIIPDYTEIDNLLEKDFVRVSSSSSLRFNLGSIAVLKEDFDSASRYYNDAHRLAGTFPQALRNEALSLMILYGVSDENRGLLDDAVQETKNIGQDIEIPVVDGSYTRQQLGQLLFGFAGFVSDHDDLSEQDPVVEVRHDKLYPGAPCK